jgi:zinc-ribbon family
MLFVFGWGRTTQQHIHSVMRVRCPNCNNVATWHALGRTTWFTLFFVPVIPYNKYYFLHCEVCSRGFELSREEFIKAQTLADLRNDYYEKKLLSREQYQVAFNDVSFRDLRFENPTGEGTRVS